MSLLGPSGCGKSTLLKLLTGVIKPEAGRILVDGEKSMALRNILPICRRMTCCSHGRPFWIMSAFMQESTVALRICGKLRQSRWNPLD